MTALKNHPSKWLRSDAASAFDRAEDDHGRFSVNSAGRTEAEQQELIRRWDRGGAANRPPYLYSPARPAKNSNHVRNGGVAVDLGDWRRFATICEAYGFRHSYPGGDPVHFDFVGVPSIPAGTVPQIVGFSQDTLNRQNFLNSRTWRIVADGIEGPRTRLAYKEYQAYLKSRGWYSGAIDGVWGPGTEAGHKKEVAAAAAQPVPRGALNYRLIQQGLNKFGYGLAVDGVWGRRSSNALADFQRKHGLYVDRIVGPKTRAALGI